jgi:hypothetical protein
VTGGYDTCVKVWDCRSWNQDPIQTMTHCKVSRMTRMVGMWLNSVADLGVGWG